MIEQSPKGFNWAMFPPLKGTSQDQTANPQTFSISQQSQHKAEAMQFIAYALNVAEHGEARRGRLADPGRARRRRRSSSSRRSTTAAGATPSRRCRTSRRRTGCSLNAYPRWKAEIATPAFRSVPREPDRPRRARRRARRRLELGPRARRRARAPGRPAAPAGPAATDLDAKETRRERNLLTDRAVGCLAGAAIGDALGGATEGWESDEIHDALRRLGRGRRSSRCGREERAQAVLAVLEGRRARHRRHADDARARAGVRDEARPPRRLRRRAPGRAGDRRRDDVDPRARPRGPALPPSVPRREVARAEAPVRARRPARRGRRQHRQLRRRDVHRAGRHRERGRSRRRVHRGARPDRRAPVELRPRGGGRAGGRVAEAMRPGGDRRLGRRGRAAARQGRDGDGDRGGRRCGGEARRLARRRAGELRAAFAPFDSVGEHYAGRRRTRASRAGCTRSRRCRSRSACSSRRAATTPRRCSAASTTAATPTRSPRWAALSRARSASPVPPRVDRGDRDGEQARPRGAGPRRWPRSREEIFAQRPRRGSRRGRAMRSRGRPFEGDVDPAGGSRRARAPAGARGGQGRRRGRGALARRGRGPAPGAARRRRPRAAELRALALELLDELDGLPRPLAGRARRASTRSCRGRPGPARASRRPPRGSGRLARPRRRLRAREAGREHPARGHPRDRAGARATGRSRGWFTADGLDPAESRAVAVEPRQPADEPRREHRRHPRGRRPQLHDARRRAARALRAGFTSLDVAKLWLDFLPPGRIFTAERVAMRNLLEAHLPPETATRRNPFREWIGARLRVDAYGWARRRRSVRAARMAWEDARLSHTANGVYAAMWMAAAHAASLTEDSRRVRRRRPPVVPAREPAGGGDPVRARARRREWEERRRRALRVTAS